MAVEPKYESIYTGQEVEAAIARALPLDTFEVATDEAIGGLVYHVLWKVRPTNANTVHGFTIHPSTGELYSATSTNGVKAVARVLDEGDTISETDINSILGVN